jgi:hypothetical protein
VRATRQSSKVRTRVSSLLKGNKNASTRLTRNRAVRNADLGIEAVPGVLDGGGNKASRNGDPLQCSNVFCK